MKIISPNMPLFRQLLVKKIRELSDKYAPFIRVIPYILLSEGGINAPKYLLIPDDEECAQLYKKADEFRNVAYDIAAYLYDIKVESQNILLSEFFENRVSLRKPNKEGAIVLTSEKEEMLDKIKELLEKNLLLQYPVGFCHIKWLSNYLCHTFSFFKRDFSLNKIYARSLVNI